MRAALKAWLSLSPPFLPVFFGGAVDTATTSSLAWRKPASAWPLARAASLPPAFVLSLVALVSGIPCGLRNPSALPVAFAPSLSLLLRDNFAQVIIAPFAQEQELVPR